MNKQQNLHLKLELIWWLFTIILAGGVLYPIINKVEPYPFLLMNIVFIIVFITFTRYIFLLRHTFIAKKQLLKVILMICCLPLGLYIINCINFFQTYIDERGIDAIVGSLPLSQREPMMNYIRTLLLFFGVGAIIATVIFAIRLMISVWRFRNRGTI